jgi:hypothetical protein
MPSPGLADATDHRINPDVFLDLDREIRETKRVHEDAGAAVARAKKAAKNAGVKPVAYAIIEKVRRLDDDEQVVIIDHVVRYFKWLGMPIGSQLSLLDAPKVEPPKKEAKQRHAVWAAGEAGLKAGREGDPASNNPYQPGSEQHAHWARRHNDGLGERATAAKMGDTEKERPADVAPATRRGRKRPGANGRAGQVGQALDGARKHLNGDSTLPLN